MTLDELRTGAGIVRTLMSGEWAARFALSDFLEEYGIPNRAGGVASLEHLARTLIELRGETPTEPSRSVQVHIIGRSFAYCLYRGPKRTVWIGTWPLWAWRGEDIEGVEFEEDGEG